MCICRNMIYFISLYLHKSRKDCLKSFVLNIFLQDIEKGNAMSELAIFIDEYLSHFDLLYLERSINI